jgi:hypothetical protein
MTDSQSRGAPTPRPWGQRFAEHVAALLRDGPPLDGVRVAEAVAVRGPHGLWSVEVTMEDGATYGADNFHAVKGPGPAPTR